MMYLKIGGLMRWRGGIRYLHKAGWPEFNLQNTDSHKLSSHLHTLGGMHVPTYKHTNTHCTHTLNTRNENKCALLSGNMLPGRGGTTDF